MRSRPCSLAPLFALLAQCAASVAATTAVRIPGPLEVEPPASEQRSAPFDPTESAGFTQDDARCSRGIADGCLSLAARYEYGRGVDADSLRARALLRPLCASHTPGACALLAQSEVFSNVAETAVRARAMASRGCASGDHQSCLVAADAMARGLGGPVEEASVEPTLRAACTAGHHASCAALALWLIEHTPSAREEALALARVECSASEARACLAKALATEDSTASLALVTRACELGYPRACVEAAQRIRLQNRSDDARDRARSLFSRACFSMAPPAGCAAWVEAEPDLFNARSQRVLLERACLFERDPAVCSRFVRRALTEASFDVIAPVRAWLAPACALGNRTVCVTLAAIESREVWDHPRAEAVLREGCEAGDGFACGRWGDLLGRTNAGSRAGFERWAQGCSLGDFVSCRSLADTLLSQHERQRSPAIQRESYRWATQGCQLSDVQSCALAVRAAQSEQERALSARAACALGAPAYCRR